MADQVIAQRTMTLEEYEVRYAGRRYEYVDGKAVPMGPEIVGADGEVIVAPTKAEHGELAGEIGRLIGNFVHAHKLGKVYGAETGFLMEQDPPQVRAADIAFLSRERAQAVRRKQWLPFPPDLAVEIVSEYERAADLRRKARSYLANGTRLLWLIYPDEREIEVHRPGQPLQTLGVEDTLEGGDVLPGFRATVREIFAVLDEMVDSEDGP